MKKELLILFYLCILIIQTSAQTVSNVTAEQVDKTIHVSYDLDMQAEISLHLSIDGGKIYTQLYKVSGDVGKNITEGHKTIIWDVLAEQERLVGDDIVFKVQAQGASCLEFTVNGVTFKMIYVEGGTFTMGCTSEQGSDCYSDEKPLHRVAVYNIYIGETEVTQALWEAVMENNPSGFKNENHPVEYVSWNDCQKFLQKLNSLTGKTFRLPTEAEWEYTARGGNMSIGYKYAGGNFLNDIACYANTTTSAVKMKLPNELGLYDMSGNVWEWCSDWYSNSYYGPSFSINPQGPSSGLGRVLRGGCWTSGAVLCRVTSRTHNDPDTHNDRCGFRLALDLE